MNNKPTYEELEQRIKELEREYLEPKKAGSETTTEKDFYETILNSIINGVWVSDKNDVIYYTNKGMEIIAGVPGEHIEGSQVLKDFPESTLKFFRPYYLKTKETLHPCYYDAVPVTTPAGRDSYQSGWLIPRIKDGIFDGLICTVEDITNKKNAENALMQSEERYRKANDELEQKVVERTAELSKAYLELKIKASKLEEINTAVTVLLKKREEDKRTLKEQMLSNVKKLVIPYIDNLKQNKFNGTQTTNLELLETSLNDIISPFTHKLSSKYLNLTPAEIKVADLVKQGKTTKEIADLLSLSYRTIERHRENIRGKVGIKNRKINLQSHLSFFQ